jgi:hypothetical protein
MHVRGLHVHLRQRVRRRRWSNARNESQAAHPTWLVLDIMPTCGYRHGEYFGSYKRKRFTPTTCKTTVSTPHRAAMQRWRYRNRNGAVAHLAQQVVRRILVQVTDGVGAKPSVDSHLRKPHMSAHSGTLAAAPATTQRLHLVHAISRCVRVVQQTAVVRLCDVASKLRNLVKQRVLREIACHTQARKHASTQARTRQTPVPTAMSTAVHSHGTPAATPTSNVKTLFHSSSSSSSSSSSTAASSTTDGDDDGGVRAGTDRSASSRRTRRQSRR